MKKKIIIAAIFLGLITACVFEKPFDNTLLDDDYWEVFQSSLSQIAFDHHSFGCYGYRNDSKKGEFIYFCEFWDTIQNGKLYFMHEREGQRINSSLVDSIMIDSDKYQYRIEWDANSLGYIFGSTKYNATGGRVSFEEYKFKYFDVDTINGTQTKLDPCQILEKKKFNGRGELLETIEYTYFDDGGYKTESIK